MNEYLRRIDERDYLTQREHREFLDRLNKDLEQIELLKLELEVEKIKVKYVMKELKKQDGILNILKEFLKDADTGTGWIEININPEHDILDSEEHKEKQKKIKEWLDK